MSEKQTDKVEYGDFQTPYSLCEKVCRLIHSLHISPMSVVEPTCGKGSFLRASANTFTKYEKLLGFEINPDYVKASRTINDATVYCIDFFEKDWLSTMNQLREPILVLGNPPWVTNAMIGALGGGNLPIKSNFHRLNGFDAITGKSNFDISEWMLSHLLECLSGRSATVAMLCKTSVARKVLKYIWNKNLQIRESAIYSINALEHFGASVDACLLVCILEPGKNSRECRMYRNLDTSISESVISYHRDRLIANLSSFQRCEHLYGKSSRKWRSGIKHDCSRVMELVPNEQHGFMNGFGKIINLEPAFLYPMLKSSELMKEKPLSSRIMLVTQRKVGEDTSRIARKAPETWAYLEKYASLLDRRASIIYRNQARFSIFGVGSYAFAPWKIAISGFCRSPQFHIIGPKNGKPVVFDDTCYFLSCQTQNEARLLHKLLESELAKEFFESFVFWDAKRPITADILGHLNLDALSVNLGVSLPARSGETLELPFE